MSVVEERPPEAIERAIAALEAGRLDGVLTALDTAPVGVMEVPSARSAARVLRGAVHALRGDPEWPWREIGEVVDPETADAGVVGQVAGRVAELVERAPSPAALAYAARVHGLGLRAALRLGRDARARDHRVALTRLRERGAPTFLGGVRLLEPVARGGSGDVWKGRHDSGATVAVKLVTVDAAVQAEARRAILAEVGAIAALDHPNIVWLSGVGSVDAAAETLGGFVVDTPYLVLEFVPHGTLEGLCGAVPWDVVRSLLLGVLDALAHAHARERLHLDLKPGNVLVGGSVVAPIPKLADFGISLRLTERSSRRRGTPEFMAPEQLRGEWREFGPPTDLYALGCLGWELVTGEPPYFGDTADAVLAAHRRERLPPLAACTAVPTGLEAWLGRLLAQRPSDRFPSAPDAARGLARLGPPSAATEIRPIRQRQRRMSSAPTMRLQGTGNEVPGPHTLIFDPAADAITDDGLAGPATLEPAPAPPARWATAPWPRRATLVEAGRALAGLRVPAFSGREPERTALWDALRATCGARIVGTIALLGAPGVGRSALARWLAERAVELGVATAFVPEPGPDGLRRALLRVHRTDGLAGAELRDHLSARVADPLEVDAIAAAAEGQVSPATVARLVSRHLARSAAARPVVVVADQPDPTSPLRRVLAELAPLELPVRVVAVVADDDPLAAPPAARLAVGPLPDGAIHAILAGRMPLHPDLRDRVTAAAGGRPAVALGLVSALAAADRLSRTASGWRADGPLPTDLGGAWRARVAASGAARVLRALAVGGPLTDDELAALVGPAAGLDAAVSAGLVDRVGTRWRAAPPAAEAALSQVPEAERRALHAACAALPDRDEGRRGRHLLGAGRADEALTALVDAAHRASGRDLDRECSAWLDEAEHALAAADAAANDPRRLAITTLRARSAVGTLDRDGLERAVARLRDGRDREGWAVEPGLLARYTGDLLALDGRFDEAHAAYEEALASTATDDLRTRTSLHHRLGQVGLRLGRYEDVVKHGRLGTQAGRRLGSPATLTSAGALATEALMSLGRLDEAAAVNDECLDAALAARIPLRLAEAHTLRGWITLLRGAPDDAIPEFREALRRYEVLGLHRPASALGIAFAALLLDRDDEARAILDGDRASRTGVHRSLRTLVELMLYAGRPGDDADERITELGAGGESADEPLVRLGLEAAARRAEASPWPERGARIRATFRLVEV